MSVAILVTGLHSVRPTNSQLGQFFTMYANAMATPDVVVNAQIFIYIAKYITNVNPLVKSVDLWKSI